MARKRKWLKMSEPINSLEDWNQVYTKLKNEIEKTGLTYSKEYDEKYWFLVQILNKKITGGWNSFSLGYNNIDELVKSGFNKYGVLTLHLNVNVNLEIWEKE